MKEIVILSAARTAGGKFGGTLASMTAPEFGAVVVRETIKRSGIMPEEIDQTIFANAWQANVGPNAARLVSVNGGVPVDTPAVSINVRCGSSIQALIFGVQAIKAGDVNTVLVGGTESTSQIPFALPKARWGYRMGKGEVLDLMHKDGFLCPLGGGLMGELTDALAKELNISRKDQDQFAAESHNKTEAAVNAGKFEAEIVPIEVRDKKNQVTIFKEEEIFRKGVTAESLAKLRPAFNKDGTITAANACALCDAAAAQIIMEGEKAMAMGLEPMAKELNISRKDQDQFAAESHNKTEAAVNAGKFEAEIVPIEVRDRKNQVTIFKEEEIFRKGVTAESLAKLRPAFNKDGTITAANACALCDAAAAQIIMEGEKAMAMGLEPMALIRGYSFVGYEPKRFGKAPVKAIPAALKQAGLTLSDIDLIELNEAFAAQYIACERELNIDRTKVNVHGGAIALGHPVGATGSKILTTLLYAMKDRNAQLGMVSACIGGGNGVALVVERLN